MRFMGMLCPPLQLSSCQLAHGASPTPSSPPARSLDEWSESALISISYGLAWWILLGDLTKDNSHQWRLSCLIIEDLRKKQLCIINYFNISGFYFKLTFLYIYFFSVGVISKKYPTMNSLLFHTVPVMTRTTLSCH